MKQKKRTKLSTSIEESLILNPLSKFLLILSHLCAKIFKFWQYPRQSTFPDKIRLRFVFYYTYKCKNPIIFPMKHSDFEEKFRLEQQKTDHFLPEAFQVLHKVKFHCVGDLMNTPGLQYSKNLFYQPIAEDLFEADISYANLESTLTNQVIEKISFSTKKMPKINATLDQYIAFTQYHNSKFDVVHTANNHIMDMGEEGFNVTHDMLDRDGISYTGTNRTSEGKWKPLIIEKNGIRFGIIGATFSINGRALPEGKNYLVNLVPFHSKKEPDVGLILTQIRYCHEHEIDCIVVSLHWGLEFEFYPTERQIRLAHEFADAGADLVISHHAHNIQPYEYYRPKGRENQMVPILYGLGNLTGIMSHPSQMLSFLAQLTIVKGIFNGKSSTRVQSMNLIPTFQLEHFKDDFDPEKHHNAQSNEADYYLSVEKLSEFLNYAGPDEYLKADIDQMKKYVSKFLGMKWLAQ